MKNRASVKEEKRRSNKLLACGKHTLKHLYLCLIIFFALWFSGVEASCLAEGKAEHAILENGMVILLKEVHNLPLVNIFLCVRTGSAQEEKFSGYGISHFVEHMLFKGTSRRKPGEIFKEIESYGGIINGFTSYDYTAYYITVPKEFAFCALDIIADMAINASFDQQELEKERQVILKEIKLSYDNPQKYVSRLLWQTAYLVHPYKYPILGQEHLFRKLGREDLIEYYQSRYTPENMTVAIVGDIEPQKTITYCRELFKNFQRKSVISSTGEPEPKQEELRECQEGFTAGMTYLLLGFHSVAITDKDCFPLDVLGAILGEGESSRLYKSICRKKNLAFNVRAINYTPGAPGLFIISCFLKESNRKRVQSLIRKQIKLVQKNAISENELEAAKNKIVSDILFHQQTIEAQAQDLALNEVLTGDYMFTEKYIQGIKQVTSEDILRVANKYLVQNNLNIAALIPREKSQQLNSFEDSTRPLKIGIENLSLSTVDSLSIEVNKYVLANGLTLLVKRKDDLPLVNITAVFKGGLRIENQNTNGVCDLLVKTLDKGTKTRNAAEIASLIEAKGARLSSFSGNNSFGFTLNLLRKDFDQMLMLLADIIKNPVFPQKEFKREKENSLAELNAREDNIFEAGIRLLKMTLFQNHPYRFLTIGNETSLNKLKRRDLINLHRECCVGRNMVLAVFGDVEAKDVFSKVEEVFAELSDEKPLLVVPSEEPKLTSTQKAKKTLSKQQSLLLLGFHGTDVYNQDKYALELICQIFSQASGRLFTQIREKTGLAYTLAAYSVLGLDPGYIVIYVATTEENIATVKEEIFHQLDSLKQKSLTEEELNQAKRALCARKLISRQTNSSCALETALDELYGLGYNNYLEYADQINSLEAKDIIRVANQYFNINSYAEVVIGPHSATAEQNNIE